MTSNTPAPSRPSPMQRLEQAISDLQNRKAAATRSDEEAHQESSPHTPPRKSRSRSREKKTTDNNWKEFAPRKARVTKQREQSPELPAFESNPSVTPVSPQKELPPAQSTQPMEEIVSNVYLPQQFKNEQSIVANTNKAPTEEELKRRKEYYRTQLCQQFMKTGKCKNGDNCDFAHGQHQIRRKEFKGPLWKTQMCFAYQKGKCSKPIQLCSYAHGPDDLRQKQKGKRPSHDREPGEINDPLKRRGEDRNQRRRNDQRMPSHDRSNSHQKHQINSMYQINQQQMPPQYFPYPMQYPYYHGQKGREGQKKGQESQWQGFSHPAYFNGYTGYPPLPQDYVPPQIPYGYPPFQPYNVPPHLRQEAEHPAQTKPKSPQKHHPQSYPSLNEPYRPSYSFPPEKGSADSLTGGVSVPEGYPDRSSPGSGNGPRY